MPDTADFLADLIAWPAADDEVLVARLGGIRCDREVASVQARLQPREAG
ncbi:MAG TPA: hypothetical protein VK104_04220 [Burkholderiaceae bacterium]|nr:hypothetical protein [Burkholderiaceae bacterium]